MFLKRVQPIVLKPGPILHNLRRPLAALHVGNLCILTNVAEQNVDGAARKIARILLGFQDLSVKHWSLLCELENDAVELVNLAALKAVS